MIRKTPLSLNLLVWICMMCFQTNYAQKNVCLQVDKDNIIERAFASFEKDIFKHYKFSNDTIKTYRTFLAEIAKLSIDLRNLPSSSSIQISRDFKNLAEKGSSIWINLSDFKNQETLKKGSPLSKNSKGELLIFNYRAGFIQCLKNTSESEEFQGIVKMLEDDPNVGTSMIAKDLYNLPTDEFNTFEVKMFVAFDIYYSILMIVEKNFNIQKQSFATSDR